MGRDNTYLKEQQVWAMPRAESNSVVGTVWLSLRLVWLIPWNTNGIAMDSWIPYMFSKQKHTGKEGVHTGNLEEGELLLRFHLGELLECREEQGTLVLVDKILGGEPVIEIHTDTDLPEDLLLVGIQAILDADNRIVGIRIREG